MIYHFLLALILSVIIMPKTAMSLNELNEVLTEKLNEEPLFVMELQGKSLKLDQAKREIIKTRWIDKVELLRTPCLKDSNHVSTPKTMVKVFLKKRKVDDFWEVVEQENMHL